MNHLSLFSGIGGIDLAAEWAGMRTVAFVEQNKFCQQVLAKHWPGVPIHDDVRTVGAKDFAEPIDVISGGFPCQPFSTAGNRMGNEDDRALWPEFARLIKELRPAWVVGENVAGIISLALDDVLASLESLGYSARSFVIPACAVGARHRRERVFIVANSGSVGLQGKRPGPDLGSEIENDARRSAGGGASARNVADPIGWEQELSGEIGRMGRAQQISRGGHWEIASEPFVCRGTHGIPRRMDRLKSLGNAVVPQQIYPIMKAIAEIGI
jgi:DNA (cytosine-5)-methyltransferase 1